MITRTYFVRYTVYDQDDSTTDKQRGYSIIRLWFWQETYSSILPLLRERCQDGDLIMIDSMVRV